ncbi:hypothetical protein ACLOJK_029691 [Asimina triloba]
MEGEDPGELKHRKAQFLVAKTLEKADSLTRRRSSLRLRLCKLKIKIGKRLRRLRKRMQVSMYFSKIGIYQHVVGTLKLWKSAIRGHDQSDISLPPLFG